MMYYVYVQYSRTDHHFYIGFTSNVSARMKQHQDGKVESTKYRKDLKLIYVECYLLESDARRNEKYYKTSKGKTDLRKKLESYLGP